MKDKTESTLKTGPKPEKLDAGDKSEKMDRRVRKTRALLEAELMKLLKEKEVKDISVKELTDLADVNRGTFYLHYADIYDMLDQIEEELFIEFNLILDKNLRENNIPGSAYGILEDMFVFLYQHKETAQVLMGPHGDLSFVNRLKDVVKNRMHYILQAYLPPDIDLDLSFAFIVAGCTGIIEAWLNSPNPCSPQILARQCANLIQRGLNMPL